MSREWLVTNGLGGYASGTLAGALTRRYHALLIAALASPHGRYVLLNHLLEKVACADQSSFCIGSEQPLHGDIQMHGAVHLVEFRLEQGIPVWQYNIQGIVLQKRILMPHMQNTVHISYRYVSGEQHCTLELRPFLRFRSHDAALGDKDNQHYTITARDTRYEIAGEERYPVLRMKPFGEGARFVLDGGQTHKVHHHVEAQLGYEALGALWTPGFLSIPLREGQEFTLVCSCEEWSTLEALTPPEALAAELSRREHLVDASVPGARQGISAELVLASDQFIISPVGRNADAVRTHAFGDEVRSVIAGYHWFTDWGRDTMISLEGLTLVTGRHSEAGWILRTFAHYICDGLIPNLFPEGKDEGLYHTADATLWFFHALRRYLDYTNDRPTMQLLLQTLISVVEHHISGTRFGIGVDKSDGLLFQGQEGYQLTWMDAKVEGWVVTPRRGKAVEINALWYNALRILQAWLTEERGEGSAQTVRMLADQVYASFNARFWYDEGGYLYDVIDGEAGEDQSCRPNQILAISLDYPVLAPERWSNVLGVVTERLLTPVGLRSLAPGHPDYKEKYFGDLRSRDAAYHQGTIWGWLIGPYIDAWMKVNPDRSSDAHELLRGFYHHMNEACVGSISEVFDAEAPFTPRGCIAQAWSVAEVLRCFVKTSEG